jgi:prepilin-type N-terminal cleavage/methylation domain-containing protein
MSPRCAGFSLVEVLVAMALTTTLLACVFALMNPAEGAFASQPEVADVQQRLRVAVDSLRGGLVRAGAGADVAGQTGPLIHFFAPVLPFREDLSGGHGIDAIRTDAVTAFEVSLTAAQTTLADDLLPGNLTARVVPERGCQAGTNLCGFSPGMSVAVYDNTGNFGVFTVNAIKDASAEITLSPRLEDSQSVAYRSGSNIVEVRVHSFSLKSDVRTQTFQLMQSDGPAGATVPVVDHLVGLSFDYFGEPRPPSLTTGVASYGPAPPPAGVQTTAYPAGENCTFQRDPISGESSSRLPPLAAGVALVPLTAAQLTDGPWCPDDANVNRWDADLLRIRTIAITVRVEAALAALRGPAGVLFANAGSSRSASRWLPDQEIQLRISPRNMNLGRQ